MEFNLENNIVKAELNLKGGAFEIDEKSRLYPDAFREIPDSPKKLFVIGNPNSLEEGIAVVGARKATPYGLSCTEHFASLAAKQGITIISGGAYGCDSAAHKAAIKQGGKTVVFLGGGCNYIYPPNNKKLYQEIIDKGGAVVSENGWNYKPMRHTFLKRNRLIAGLAKATLITEASVPSGTFSTADFALKYNKDVLAIPGAITNPGSAGCNKLIAQGAYPVFNDESFYDYLFDVYDCLKPCALNRDKSREWRRRPKDEFSKNPIVRALMAQSMNVDELYDVALKNCKEKNPSVWLSEKLIEGENDGLICKYKNGLYGPVVK